MALAVIALVYGRSEGRPFHLPFGDGGWVTAAGAWCAVLILSRLFERPLGQTLLALASAAILMLPGCASKRAGRRTTCRGSCGGLSPDQSLVAGGLDRVIDGEQCAQGLAADQPELRRP
ncbi:MAG: hypothetical protein WKF31_06095 [Thermoleophilaceae bacterium]